MIDNPIKTRTGVYEHGDGKWYRSVMRSSKRTVELYVSPTGRSQRVFVDGVEVKSDALGEQP